MSVLNLLGLALKLCCLAFFLLGHTEKESERHFYIYIFFDTLYDLFFYSSIFALEVIKDLHPRLTQSRAWDIKVWQVIVSASFSDSQRAFRDSQRAFKASTEGKIQAAVAKAMEPFEPTRAQDEVIKRPVMDTIKNRIKSWREHATIIGGRYLSGKSVAVEEALRGVRGVV